LRCYGQQRSVAAAVLAETVNYAVESGPPPFAYANAPPHGAREHGAWPLPGKETPSRQAIDVAVTSVNEKTIVDYTGFVKTQKQVCTAAPEACFSQAAKHPGSTGQSTACGGDKPCAGALSGPNTAAAHKLPLDSPRRACYSCFTEQRNFYH